MNEMPYPITNEAGELFCMAQRSPNGGGVILKGKNCEIPLTDLQMRALRPQDYCPRNKRSTKRRNYRQST